MRFMVSIRIEVPPERAEEARALLPAEREHVAEQLRQGVLEALYTDEPRPATQVWAVMRADSLEATQRLVEGYPLYEFFQCTYTTLHE